MSFGDFPDTFAPSATADIPLSAKETELTLALRPYVTAGVALVGAGIIAVTPVAAPPPTIQAHTVQLTAAIDNPVEVFAPVFDKARTVIETNIQNELANPFPIANAVLARALADGQTLGDIANTLAPVITNLVKGFPVTTEFALKKLAAGDLDGALGAYVGLFFGPVFVGFMQYQRVIGLVGNQFDVGKRLAAAAMNHAWGMTIGIALAGFSLATTTAANIEEVGKAIGTGDPAKVVNAIQHGVANIASAAISQADYIKLVVDPRQAFGKAINPPPPDPEEEFRTANAVPEVEAISLPATSSAPVETPAAETISEEITETSPSAEATQTEEAATRETKPSVRDSLVAAPGKFGNPGKANRPAVKVASDVRDGISSTVNKISEGVKKAIAKPEKKSASSAGAGKGPDSGSSGDAK